MSPNAAWASRSVGLGAIPSAYRRMRRSRIANESCGHACAERPVPTALSSGERASYGAMSSASAFAANSARIATASCRSHSTSPIARARVGSETPGNPAIATTAALISTPLHFSSSPRSRFSAPHGSAPACIAASIAVTAPSKSLLASAATNRGSEARRRSRSSMSRRTSRPSSSKSRGSGTRGMGSWS